MNLRMDDTNPDNEYGSHIDSIMEMAAWLGVEWSGDVRYASDYFDAMFDLAKMLIVNGLAYMDFANRETMRAMRGDLNRPGKRCDDADGKSADWHLAMFETMALGIWDEGSCVLRARLDMASPNMNMRDPVLYRIKKTNHPRTGSKWLIYPSYDYAHPISDYFERIALSLCTLEFEDHRPFYDWVIGRCAEYLPDAEMAHAPVELEFARLELDRGLTSKRKVNSLVKDGLVDGFDDPRLATLSALRRKGFTASSIMTFIEEAGISKANSVTPFSRLEDFLRIELDPVAPRRLVIAEPIELVVEGEPIDGFADAPNHPKNESAGSRRIGLANRWWIDASDVRLAGAAEKGFKRVEPGAVFRIMYASVLECVAVEADENGRPARVFARISAAKPKATIHGISISTAVGVEIWEPEMLENENDDPGVRLVVKHGYAEPLVLTENSTFHAVRYGYCVVDRKCPGRLILTVKLRSSF